MQHWHFLTHAGFILCCAMACGGTVSGSNDEVPAQGGASRSVSVGGAAGGATHAAAGMTSGASSAASAGANAAGKSGSGREGSGQTGSGQEGGTAGAVSAGANAASNAGSGQAGGTGGAAGAGANTAGNASNGTTGGVAGSNSTIACQDNVGGAASGQCPDIPPMWPDCCVVGDFQPSDASPGGMGNASAPERLAQLGDAVALANAVREGAKVNVLRQYSEYWSSLRWANCTSVPTQHATGDANSPCIPIPDPPPGAVLDAPPPNFPDPAPGPDSNGSQRGTNYVVPGVDAPDRWQFDDRYLYVLTSTGLLILDVKDPANTVVVARLPLEGTAKDLFVVGTRALVVSAAVAKAVSHCFDAYDCQFWGDVHQTWLSVIDIADRKSPRLLSRVELSGGYIGGGMIGTNAHVVTADGLAVPKIAWAAPDLGVTSTAAEAMSSLTAQYQAAIASLATANVSVSAPSAQTIAVRDDGSSQAPTPLNPKDVYWSRGLTSSAVSITSLNLGAETEIRQQLVYTRPGAVHTTADLLWLAIPEYVDDSDNRGKDTTWIHGFALSGPDVTYRGSGRIDGHISNRFTLDQRQGDLRIATTKLNAPFHDAPAHSTLSVLGWQGDQLSLLSEVSPIAPGKYLRSVRFAGPRAYATVNGSPDVPVFDLSGATAAKALGELDLTGSATYVYALDDYRVVTIGTDAPLTSNGDSSFHALLLQVLDLSDPTKPIPLSSTTIDTLGTTVQYFDSFTERLSLNYFESQNLLALPMTVCASSANGKFADVPTFMGLTLYDLSAASDLTPRGRIAYPAPSGYYYNSGEPNCSKWWSSTLPPLVRSAVVGNHILGLSSAVLEISSLANPGQVVAAYAVGEVPCDDLDESTCAANLHCLPIRGVRLASGIEEYLGCASTRSVWAESGCTSSTHCATSFSSLDCATVQSSCVPYGWGKLAAASCSAALCGG